MRLSAAQNNKSTLRDAFCVRYKQYMSDTVMIDSIMATASSDVQKLATPLPTGPRAHISKASARVLDQSQSRHELARPNA